MAAKQGCNKWLRLDATTIIFTLAIHSNHTRIRKGGTNNMLFGDKLKKEREERGWSQDYLAEKIYVSRQSVSKWETNKNYPSIEVIINLSNLFNITIDELLRSDEGLKEKVIQDSKERLSWQSYILISVGVLIGIVVVSLIKHQGINWMSIGRATGVAVILSFIYVLLRQGVKKVEQKG